MLLPTRILEWHQDSLPPPMVHMFCLIPQPGSLMDFSAMTRLYFMMQLTLEVEVVQVGPLKIECLLWLAVST